MHGGVVEHFLALGHAQKARALFERLGAELGHFQNLLARGEPAVLLSVLDDVGGDARVQPRNARQKGRGSRIDVDADGVHAVFNDAVERFGEPLFGHIVLVLPHADGLGVDLDELRKRILQPPRDGDGGAQVDVVFGELRRRQLGRGIDGSARLVDDGIRDARPLAEGCDELHRHLLGLAARGAVADGDVPDLMLLDESRKDADGLRLLPFAVSGIDDRRIEHLARAVDDRHLAAHAVTGVEPHRDEPLDGRLHEERAQIERELPDGALGSRLCEGGAHLALQRGLDEAVKRVLGGGFYKGGRSAGGLFDDAAEDELQGVVARDVHPHFEDALLFAAVERKHAVRRDALDRAGELVVVAVNGIFGVLLCCLRADIAALHGVVAKRPAHGGVVGNVFGDDIPRARKRFFHRRDALFFVDVLLCRLFGGGAVLLLRKEKKGERLQALFAGDGRAGAPLLLEGAVLVLDGGKRLRALDAGAELFRELALRLDGREHFLLPLLEIAKVLQAVCKGADGLIVHRAVHLLAVAGDEGHRVALVEEGDDV